jgi:hypothetical protein
MKVITLCCWAAALAPLGRGAAAAPTAPSPSSPMSVYRQRAESAGRWISWQARCNASDGCVFPMNTTEGCCGHEYSLYYGPPGVALFYIQLSHAARQSGSAAEQEKATAMAFGAGNQMLATLSRALAVFGNNTAMYYGSGGLAFALRELSTYAGLVGKPTHAGEYLRGARRVEGDILARASTSGGGGVGVTWDNNTDVAHGASGTGLYLLRAAAEESDTARRRNLTRTAIAAGEWLLTKAVNASDAAGRGIGTKWPRGIDSDGNHTGELFRE